MVGVWSFRPHYEARATSRIHRMNQRVWFLILAGHFFIVAATLNASLSSSIFSSLLPHFTIGLVKHGTLAFVLVVVGYGLSRTATDRSRKRTYKRRSIWSFVIYATFVYGIILVAWVLTFYSPNLVRFRIDKITFQSVLLSVSLLLVFGLQIMAFKSITRRLFKPFKEGKKKFYADVRLEVVFPKQSAAKLSSCTSYEKDGAWNEAYSGNPDAPIYEPQSIANVLIWLELMQRISKRPIRISDIHSASEDAAERWTFRPDESLELWLNENRLWLATLILSIFLWFLVRSSIFYDLTNDIFSGRVWFDYLFAAIAVFPLGRFLMRFYQNRTLCLEIEPDKKQIWVTRILRGIVRSKFPIFSGRLDDINMFCVRLDEMQHNSGSSANLSFSRLED